MARESAEIVREAINDEEVRVFLAYRWVDRLKPFEYPGIDDVSLELLSWPTSPSQDPKETELIVAFQRHLGTADPQLEVEQLAEIREVLRTIARPKVNGKTILETSLTVGDFRQLKRNFIYKLGATEDQIRIALHLFPLG